MQKQGNAIKIAINVPFMVIRKAKLFFQQLFSDLEPYPN